MCYTERSKVYFEVLPVIYIPSSSTIRYNRPPLTGLEEEYVGISENSEIVWFINNPDVLYGLMCTLFI